MNQQQTVKKTVNELIWFIKKQTEAHIELLDQFSDINH